MENIQSRRTALSAALQRPMLDTAPCMNPACPNLVKYRTGPGPAPLYCSHRCRSMASNAARRLERQLEILTDPELRPDDPEERADWAQREALVRWHLLRYRGA